ncbi:MAG: GNAT family N-acetyltransferase [Streptosporangiaceae bacterium]|jgi:RimJ/RimL family protein N-acetyltransferase/GNAT superfamily N-acetyltransferase
MRQLTGGYVIDDDPARIDAAAAVAFLTRKAYWARWRGEADIRRQISEAWRVVGAYDQAGGTGAMVGFARAFSDGGPAYLADVYVLPGHRGAGLGKAIVRAMIDDGPGSAQRWMLHTSDAHGLYRTFGFTHPAGHPSRYLERPPRAERTAGPSAVEVGPLIGRYIRLEPLRHDQAPGLLAAAAGGADLYRWTAVPQDEAASRRYVETALAARDSQLAVPFAVVRMDDDAVVGSTRFWNLEYWAWPDRKPAPDTCEIGHTWLSPGTIRTGANTEMKRLMLTHAFEVWQVRSVCLHTHAQNQRSRDAMERFGARFEGILRSHRLAPDLTPRDSARYSVTAADWPSVRLRLDELARRYQLT